MLTTFSGRQASQNEWELRSFIALLKERGVTSYAEIGARHGDSFHEIMLSLPVGSRGVAVDWPGALWGKKSSVTSLTAACDDLRVRGYVIDMILGDSGSLEVAQQVGDTDAVLIDGDHRYEAVKRDFGLYGYRRITALHDIVGHEQSEKMHGTPVEVPRFWAELKAAGCYKPREFIAPGSRMGIGVAFADWEPA